MENPSKYLGNELKYLEKVLNSESWSATGGSWVHSFEKRFVERVGVRYGIAMNSGTATLHSALEAIGVKAGDEVISPAFTVIMDANATIHANAIPVFADIDPDTFTISPQSIKERLSKKTKAIITVGIHGLPPDYDAIRKVAPGIPIIEDNAQCLFNTYKGKTIGTQGELASYSFENSKILSAGEAGIIITDNEEYAMRCRKLGGHGYKNLQADEGRVRLNQEVFQNPHYKRFDTLGWNYRMSEFSAAILMGQLERADELSMLRRESAKLFIEVMLESGLFKIQKEPVGFENAYYTLSAMYNGEELIGVSWIDFRKKYVENGGDGIYGACALPYLEPMFVEKKYIYRYPEIYSKLEYFKGLCPVAERIQPKIMQFKSNYRSVELAKLKADILRKTIKELRNG